MIEYNWNITSLKILSEYNNMDNCVFQVYYCFEGKNTETDMVESVCGDHVFNIAAIDNKNFIPFEDLTQEIVVSWLESSLGKETLDDFKKQIERRMRVIEKVVLPPWVKTQETDIIEKDVVDIESEDNV
jgi:hypothetical protein